MLKLGKKYVPVFFAIILSFVFVLPGLSQPVPAVSNVKFLDSQTGSALSSYKKGALVRLHATVSDTDGLKYVRATIKDGAGYIVSIIALHDDGLASHGDVSALPNGSVGKGDGVYSALWSIPGMFNSGSNFVLLIEAADEFGNIYWSENNAVAYEEKFSVEEDCTLGSTCTDAELGSLRCGGNIIQECAKDAVIGCNYWSNEVDCGFNVCCGTSCCGSGEICSSTGTCLYCDNTCNGICADNNCSKDPDCSFGGCCGDGACDVAKECSACGSDCGVADCCGNGTCDFGVGENFTNCLSDCGCPDADGDGYANAVCGGGDCDDSNKRIFPGNTEVCDGLDNDCDPLTDDKFICDSDNDNFCNCNQNFIYTSDLSSICSGTNTSNIFWWNNTCDCDDSLASFNPGVNELCDGADNNCDGAVDEGCGCIHGNTRVCGIGVGECQSGTQTCSFGVWGLCVGNIGPVAEDCDNLDNDCDGTVDNNLISPLNSKQEGVCLNSLKICGNGLWVDDYSSVISYKSIEDSCDGLDNDCDGTVDEGCACIDGEIQSCGIDTGECQKGTQKCVNGNWEICNGEISPKMEICNGLDDDCDNNIDNDLTPPLNSKQHGVCLGSTKKCAGPGGWQDDYSNIKNYEESELSCYDSLDNDCDGNMDLFDGNCVDNNDPVVDSFAASLSGGGVNINWSVSDTGGSHLGQIEIWRAPDISGQPGLWSEVSNLRQEIFFQNTDSHSGVTTDVPPVGSWWYGLHVLDQAGNMGAEAGPAGPFNVSSCLDELVDINQNGSFSQCGCSFSTTSGYACDTNKDLSADGLCWRDSCITAPPLSMSCKTSCGTEDKTIYNNCQEGFACDNDFITPGQTFFEQDGTCALVNGISECVTSGHICKQTSYDFYAGFYDDCSDCANGDWCNINLNQGDFKYDYGFCRDGSCKQVVLPPSFDWRNLNGENWMSPIRNQGSCGSCWAFSTIAVAEAAYNIQENNPNLNIDLSEQYLVSDCCGSGDCDGGWAAFNCQTTDEACYPYTKTNSLCSAKCSDWESRSWDISDKAYVPSSTDSNVIKLTIMEKGPLWTAMNASSMVWDSANGYWKCTATFPDHGVVLTGWDDAGGYWVIKNSWGLGWGDNGYGKIKYGDCGLSPSMYLKSVTSL